MKPAWSALLLACALTPGSLRAAPVPCPATPAEAGDDIAPLPHIAASLRAGTTLEILAVGTPTPIGPGSSPPEDAGREQKTAAPRQPKQAGLSWQTARALEEAVPGLQANVTLIGKRGLTAGDMLGLMRAELPHKPYRLVLWQTGTVEAVDEASPDDFYQALADGAAAVTGAGADLVLIDPQYSRFLAANANLEPYQSALQAAATLPGVALFHRFDLMRAWVVDGAIDLERAPKAERQATATRLRACLGSALANILVAAMPAELTRQGGAKPH